jgi:transcriptional regulator with XRE-family HTH domain
MAEPTAPPIDEDPFRDWLRRSNATGLAKRIGVSRQTISAWKRGAVPRPANVEAIRDEAAKYGVTLTTDEILGVK